MPVQELTWKQRIFVKTYLSNGFNATQAAIRAGYSEDSARQIASDTLSKPYIQDFIKKQMQAEEKELGMTREWKLQKLKNCINASMNDSEESNVELKNHNAFLGAIDIANKMQGHYQEKTAVEDKLDDVSKKLDELKEKYKKDY